MSKNLSKVYRKIWLNHVVRPISFLQNNRTQLFYNVVSALILFIMSALFLVKNLDFNL